MAITRPLLSADARSLTTGPSAVPMPRAAPAARAASATPSAADWPIWLGRWPRSPSSTFDHNEALGGSGNGGGGGSIIFSRGAGGAIGNVNVASLSADRSTLTVSDSTFTNNRAVGGAGSAAGSVAGPGVGGGDRNLFGAMTTVTGSTFDGNQAIGGAGGVGGNGGNGFGGGIYNDGRSTLEVRGSTITDNQASGGAAGAGGSAGSGVGGGLYLDPGGSVCLDEFTIDAPLRQPRIHQRRRRVRRLHDLRVKSGAMPE